MSEHVVDCATCGHDGVWRPEYGWVEHRSARRDPDGSYRVLAVCRVATADGRRTEFGPSQRRTKVAA